MRTILEINGDEVEIVFLFISHFFNIVFEWFFVLYLGYEILDAMLFILALRRDRLSAALIVPTINEHILII